MQYSEPNNLHTRIRKTYSYFLLIGALILFLMSYITSGCISERIKRFLDKLISKDQTEFINGRLIGENFRIIDGIMNYTERNSIPGLLMMMDF